MTTTPRLGMTQLEESQALPEVVVNENHLTLEQMANGAIVKDKDLATPPGSPAEGDAYIVAASATGAWTGWEKRIAYYASGWDSVTPIEGTEAYVQDENLKYRYDGTNWVSTAGATDLDDLTDVNAPAPTNGQVLTWDSTPGEWVAQDLPAAGSFVLDDATDVNAPSPSDGQVLTWDSTPGEWVAAAPTGSGGWEQIGAAQNASSSATIDFTGIDPTAWDELELRAYKVVPATDATDLWLRIGTGAGPTYATGASDYSFAKTGLQGTTGAGATVTGADITFDAMQFPTTSMSNAAGETFNGRLYITGLATGEYCQAEGTGTQFRSDNAQQVMKASGRYNATTAITALRIMVSSGNIASGKFVLFGRPVAT